MTLFSRCIGLNLVHFSAPGQPSCVHSPGRLHGDSLLGRLHQDPSEYRWALPLGPQRLVLPRLGRISVEVQQTHQEDALPDDMVFVRVSKHGSRTPSLLFPQPYSHAHSERGPDPPG